MALLEARADRVPRPPTRAFVNTAEPAKPAVKGSKIAEPPQSYTATPTAANPQTPSPAHLLTASRTPTPGLPPTTSDTMAAGMRSAFGRTVTMLLATLQTPCRPEVPCRMGAFFAAPRRAPAGTGAGRRHRGPPAGGRVSPRGRCRARRALSPSGGRACRRGSPCAVRCRYGCLTRRGRAAGWRSPRCSRCRSARW